MCVSDLDPTSRQKNHCLHIKFDVATYEQNILNCTVLRNEDFAT
jgi:hypothetical protein